MFIIRCSLLIANSFLNSRLFLAVMKLDIETRQLLPLHKQFNQSGNNIFYPVKFFLLQICSLGVEQEWVTICKVHILQPRISASTTNCTVHYHPLLARFIVVCLLTSFHRCSISFTVQLPVQRDVRLQCFAYIQNLPYRLSTSVLLSNTEFLSLHINRLTGAQQLYYKIN